MKMKLSKRKSEVNNGDTAVLRQPKGPEAQGAKGELTKHTFDPVFDSFNRPAGVVRLISR